MSAAPRLPATMSERRCDFCGKLGARRSSARREDSWVYEHRCVDCTGVYFTLAIANGAIVHPTKRYADDPVCQALVGHFPDGMTLEQIGDAMGITRERVRQIELSALARLQKRLALVGIDLEEIRR